MHTQYFGIGFHKTGTSTLRECLRQLGFRVCPEERAFDFRREVIHQNYMSALLLACMFEAFEDSPWNYYNFYRILNAVFPESKFILTVRDPHRWFESILRWTRCYQSGEDSNIIYTLGVAVCEENRAAVIDSYLRRNDEIIQYFGGPNEKLLVVDWEAGDGWQQLAPFCRKPVPRTPFPHILKYDPATDTYIDAVR